MHESELLRSVLEYFAGITGRILTVLSRACCPLARDILLACIERSTQVRDRSMRWRHCLTVTAWRRALLPRR